tara:strand:+ start:1391 stop:1654 length:264 start_codon:yes stop_codon:yes gene_type:complete
MDTNIHNVKHIVKGEIVENTRKGTFRTGEKYYSMRITFIYDELGTCRERRSENTMWGDTEISYSITLFAETKEALEIKAQVLTTEEA